MTLPEWYLDEDTRTRLNAVSTATITTQLFRRGFRTRFMKGVSPLRPGTRMLGAARTLRYIPMREDLDTLDSLGGRENAQRVLIESMGPGEVMVIDGMREQGCGSLGSILALRLQVKGVCGIVTDGAYRDTPGIRGLEIPAYAAGQNANTNLTLYHPADIDLSVGCGGVMVEPGDAVLGDDEGVAVIPAYLVEEVARDAHEQEVREKFIYGEVEAGASVFDVYPMNQETRDKFEMHRMSVTAAQKTDPTGSREGE